MAWLVGSAEVKEFTSGLVQYGNTWCVAVVARLTALAQRVVKRIAAPLLAAPTHRGGWIDPLVWVERWRRLIELKVDVPEVELSQSLLRLAPDGRPAALERAREIECPLCEVIVWVLGGTVDAAAAKRTPAVWIAASRCRDPEIVLEGGGWSKGLPTGPEVLQPAVYRWKALKGTRRHNVFTGATQYEEGGDEPAIGFRNRAVHGIGERPAIVGGAQRAVAQEYSRMALEAASHLKATLDQVLLAAAYGALKQGQPGAAAEPEPLLPSLAQRIDACENAAKWVHHWAAMLWPAKMDGYWKGAAEGFFRRIDKKASSLDPQSAPLEPLLAVDQPLTELAVLALWIATLSKDADSRTARSTPGPRWWPTAAATSRCWDAFWCG